MIASFFDINTVFFTLWGYPMSYLEFFGTILNIVTVWLCTRKNVWNWPIGIGAVVLFLILFYQIHLYSDLLEQIYYLLTGFWGWWIWTRSQSGSGKDTLETPITTLSKEQAGFTFVVVALGTLALGWFMARINLFFPALFPEPASFPYLDAFTTVASFAAQIMLIFKKIENWYLWILVDIIGIWLYNVKDVKFIALLYLVFLILATSGLISWRKEFRVSQRMNGSQEVERPRKEVWSI